MRGSQNTLTDRPSCRAVLKSWNFTKGLFVVLKSWTEIGVLHLNRGQLKYSVTAGRNVLMPGSLYGDVFMRFRGPRMTALGSAQLLWAYVVVKHQAIAPRRIRCAVGLRP